MKIAKTLHLAPALAICVTILLVLAGCDAKGRALVPSENKGPLLNGTLGATHRESVQWFLIANRLFSPEDAPDVSKELLEAMEAPVDYLSFERPKDAKLAPMEAWPFAVCLANGTVILADELRLMSDQNLRGLWEHLLMLPRTVTFQPGSQWELALTLSPELRLAVPQWKLVSLWDESAHSWAPPQQIPAGLAARIHAFLSLTRRVHFFDTRSGAPGWTRESVPSGDCQAAAPSCRVQFAKPLELLLVETSDWDPNYYLNETRSASVSGRVQSLAARTKVSSADEAVIVPQHRYEDTARVYLRLTGSKRWVDAGIVPLKYP